MRKPLLTLFILSILILSYSVSNAQTSSGFIFGANVGYNSAYLTQAETSTSSATVSGFNLGVSADYYFSDHWSLKVKAIYDQKGWGDGYIIENTGAAGQTNSEVDGVNFQLNYLTIPILATWHFGRGRNWYLHFGPYVGYLVSASDSNNDSDAKSLFNSTDFGADVGFGYNYPVTEKASIFFETDIQAGVTNILTQNGGNTFQTERTSLNFGVNFNLD